MGLEDKFVDYSYGSQATKKQKVKQESDLDYMNSVSAAMLIKSSITSRALLWFAFLIIIWAITWAYFAEIDSLTRGEGKVIPSHQIQVIQNLEGGIVSEILVKEGDQVKKGDILVKIDDTGFISSFAENRLRFIELKAKSKRLYAEANSKKFRKDKIFAKKYPEVYIREHSLYLSNQRQLKNDIHIHEERLHQKQSEYDETLSKIKQLQKNYDLIQREIKINKPLYEEGIISEIEFLQLKRQAGTIEGELVASKTSLPRLFSAIQEQKNNIEDVKFTFANKSKEEYNEVIAEMKRVKKANEARADRVTRTNVRSPVDGTVKQFLIYTVGGVVKPGMDIVEIVPTQDKLIIQAKVRPADIAFLRKGQKVIVKFSAYDFAIYGSLKGELINISADTIIDEVDKQSYYLVKVATEKNYLGTDQNKLEIKVGMTANIDIITGKKTVLDYILKPILRAKQNALSER